MSKNTATINLDPLLRGLSRLERENLPFAEAVALNETAFQAKEALVAQMPKRFKGMKSSRPLKGYRVKKANKKQATREASVTHLDSWMTIHEKGGDKRPQNGKSLSVPTQEITGKSNAGGVIPKKLWARNLLSRGEADPRDAGRQGGRGNKKAGQPKAFILEDKGKRTIVKRGRKKADPLVTLYELKDKVKIPMRWDYFQTVKYSAKKNLAKNFQKAMARALETSKK